jgi:predicted O-methyltransferase YrrM
VFVFALLVTRLWVPTEGQITSVRSFFGVHSVVETADHNYHVLFHGTTMHGAMRIRDASGNGAAGRPEPLSYFYFGGPMSDAIEATRGARGTLGNVAILGLGAGSLACHLREGEQWTFFEIDPEVVRIARDPKLFRFLSSCAPSAPIMLGDARLTLAATPGQYDLIVLDVFSSDAIPVHLLTREAFAGYLSRLAPNGVIAAHVSNRHMELVSVVGAVGGAEGLIAYVKYDRKPLDGYRNNAIVVALARKIADLGDLPSRDGWQPVINRGVSPWTDDYADLLGAIIREKFGGG